MTAPSAIVLTFYGLFLITCGIVSVIFIGMKAKTALASGGLSGVIALITGYFLTEPTSAAAYAGLFISLALFCVFAWRSTLTLFKVLELVPANHPDLRGKAIAFLIISLMAVVSIFVFALQLINLLLA